MDLCSLGGAVLFYVGALRLLLTSIGVGKIKG